MMKLTLEFLKKINACNSLIERFKQEKKQHTVHSAVDIMLSEKQYEWCNWILSRTLNRENSILYACFAAREVLHIYEKKFSGDDRPRKAIEAAEKCIKDKSAYAAYAAAKEKMQIKIIKYGQSLIKKQRSK